MDDSAPGTPHDSVWTCCMLVLFVEERRGDGGEKLYRVFVGEHVISAVEERKFRRLKTPFHIFTALLVWSAAVAAHRFDMDDRRCLPLAAV